MKIQIKNWFDFSIIFECRADSISLALKLAIEKKVSLGYANLRSADLRYANLRSADLSYANLRSADLLGEDAIIDTGETWGDYLEKVIPELLKAGGHTIEPASWQCHLWDNCPIAEAFGVHSLNEIPQLLRPRAE